MTYSMGAVVVDENEVEVCHGRSVTKTTQVSEATMQKVDHEIRAIIDQQYTVARKIIEENRDKMEAMTAALLEWETIDADQINDIMEGRSEEHTSELQSLMRISYAVFCLKKKKTHKEQRTIDN